MYAISDVCRTAAIVDAAHGKIQQPAHNLVDINSPFALHRTIFCPTLRHQITARDVTATCSHAHLGAWSIDGFLGALLHFRRAKVRVRVWCSCVQSTGQEALHRVLTIYV